MYLLKWSSAILISISVSSVLMADDDYNILNKDGSFEFGYDNPDSFHHSKGNRNNVVFGEFGGRDPKTGGIDKTTYTAGPRGYRPTGKNIARKYDLRQSGPRPVGNQDDPFFDPSEDPSYKFGFNTRTYNRQEAANRVGDVTGKYTYWDDIGERHDVQYIAGKNTGFHVLTPYPDSKPFPYQYFNGRGKPLPRGRTAVTRKTDGSYSFVSVGPDQRRTETSDAIGNVRGSYTYLDEKGVQHSVHYIAGPQIGYRVLKNVKEAHLPNIFPFSRPTSDAYTPGEDYNNESDDFVPAASGHVKPIDNNIAQTPRPSGFNTRPTTTRPSVISRPSNTPRPVISNLNQFGSDYSDDDSSFDELFGNDDVPNRPAKKPSVSIAPSATDIDDGAYRPSGDDGSYKPDGARPSKPITPSSHDGIGAGGSGTSATGLRPSGSNFKPFVESSKPVGVSLKPSATRPEGPNSKPFSDAPRPKPTIQIGISGGGGTSNIDGLGGTASPDYYTAHTIVTNVGDTLFTVPPGVSVRAHVQAIDLLPLGPRSPSPSEQYKVETRQISEQLNAETSVNEHVTLQPPEISSTEIGVLDVDANSTTPGAETTTATATTVEPKNSTET